MRPLKRKNAALKRANASLKAASAFFRAKLDRHGLWYQSPHSGVAISTRSMLRQHRNLNLESLRTPPRAAHPHSCPRRNVTKVG
jgi:hypothetical protein